MLSPSPLTIIQSIPPCLLKTQRLIARVRKAPALILQFRLNQYTSRQKRHQGAYQLAYTSKMSRAEVLAMKRDPGLPVGCGTAEDRLYLGDNLPILLHLVDDPTLRGCIRCVYIDPPYATASSFVDRDVNHAYDDTVEGAAYLEFLRRRLIVLRELIAVDGTIFVHLDQTMVFEVKLIMDEVFGRENFRNFITRKKCNTKNYTRRKFGNVSDHILFYSKADDFVWHRPHEVYWFSRNWRMSARA